MARQPYFSGQTEKAIEVYGAFGGGMNTQEHPSKLGDGTFVMLENIDVVAGGVIMNRGGYKRINDGGLTINGITQNVTGMSQGIFYYDNLSTGITIEAVGGQLYTIDADGVYRKIFIVNLLGGFQTTRPIEGIQYRNYMFFATGSGLVRYDGTAATLVSAYQPTGEEGLYIGTNGYAADPDNFLADNNNGVSNRVLGLKTDQRYGIINKAVTFTAFIERIASDTLEYKFSSKMITEPKFTEWATWSTAKAKAHTFAKNSDYQVKCEYRKQGTTVTLGEYVLPKFRVASVADAKPEPVINFDDMKLCNRILLHYDRLVLYGDTNNPDHMYTSHLNNFAYFPRTNIMRITDPLRGSLRSVVQYKNFLVCFTDNSISMITGMSPVEYVKSPVHTTLGTKYPYSVRVMKNYIVFVSQDGNVYILKSFNYSTTDKLNVDRIDLDIRESIKTAIGSSGGKVMATIYNDQYYLYIKNGTNCYIYRYYYEYDIWIRDSVVNNFSCMESFNGKLYLTTDSNGKLYQLTRGFFYDDVTTNFNMTIRTKDYDFGMPHHKKKLKQFQVVAKMLSNSQIACLVMCDNVGVTNTNAVGDPTKNYSDSQKFNITTSGRFRYISAVMTIQVRADIQLLSFGFVFKQGSPK